MLGIPDFWILLAYLLCIISAVACVIYGLKNWNKGGYDEKKEIEEERAWQKKEIDIEKNM